MSLIIPVPLLSLCSGKLFEVYVCGSEVVDVAVLKKVVRLVVCNICSGITILCPRYRDISESDQLVTWLWQTLESFTNEERLLFLRFVSGRSRLPANVNDISQRFQIMKWGKVTILLCFICYSKLFLLPSLLIVSRLHRRAFFKSDYLHIPLKQC